MRSKGMFVELACSCGGATQRDVAGYLGNVSEHAVGKTRGNFRKLLEGDEAALVARLEGNEAAVSRHDRMAELLKANV